MNIITKIYGIIALIALATALAFTFITFSDPVINLKLKSFALFLYIVFAVYPCILASLNTTGGIRFILYFISLGIITAVLIFLFKGIAPIPAGEPDYPNRYIDYYLRIKIFVPISAGSIFFSLLLKKYLEIGDLYIIPIILLSPLTLIIFTYLAIRRKING